MPEGPTRGEPRRPVWTADSTARDPERDSTVESMVAGRKLRRVPASPRFQHRLLTRAAESLYAANQVADRAPSTAFINAYDAMRHSVDAHLNSHELRAESGEGGHRYRTVYADLAMKDLISADDLAYYRAARSIRNDTEYPQPTNAGEVNEPTARKAIEVAQRIHRAVLQHLRPKPSPS